MSNETTDLRDQLDASAGKLRETFSRLRIWERSKLALERRTAEKRSLEKQRQEVEKSYKSMDPADATVLAAANGYEQEEQLCERWNAEMSEVESTLTTTLARLSNLPSRPPVDVLPDASLIRTMESKVRDVVEDVARSLQSNLEAIRALKTSDDFRALDAQVKQSIESARARLTVAKENASAHEHAIAETESLAARIKAVDQRISDLNREVDSHSDAAVLYTAESKIWFETLQAQSTLVKTQCKAVSAASSGLVRGLVEIGSDLEHATAALREVARGSGVRRDRFEKLEAVIRGHEDSRSTWDEMLLELRALLDLESTDAPLPSVPLLRSADFTDQNLRALGEKLDDDSWIRLRLIPTSDSVRFEYQARKGEFIPFADASAGQRATALMTVLLAEDGGPLIVDQPEDDLDNKVIQDIAAKIWTAKSRRQLIFASHNANLVVNGDADLVVVFDYEAAGDQTSGTVAALGSIDRKKVREAVTNVMEGGHAAFSLRGNKYGF